MRSLLKAFSVILFAVGLLAAGDPAGKPAARLALGEPAPEIAAVTLDNKPMALAGLRGAHEGKIIVLQFGSITEPIFRAHAPAVEKLAAKEADKAAFVIVYAEEAHPADTDKALELNTDDGFNFAQPTSLNERLFLAGQMVDRLAVKNQTVVVDAWNNTSALRYGSYPNMTFIIDVKGNLQAGYPWMDTAKVQQAVETLAAGKPLPPELKGSVKLSAVPMLDAAAEAETMTGGRGPATIASALDKFDLTNEQRAVLYPALADFLVSLQDFRGARANLPGRAVPVPPVAPLVGSSTKPTTPVDVQSAQTALEQSATRLKSVIKQTLPEKDAKTMFDALEQMQAQNLFAN